jgi:ribosome-binding protein aMBF1 (putative translation factor)
MDNKNGWRSFQDLEPVVLKKNTNVARTSSIKSKTHIHLSKTPDVDEYGETSKAVHYTQKQIDSIITARQSKNLNQVQLAKLIMPNLNGDYIKNIENGKTPFNHVAYNRICKVLNIKPLPS